MPSGSFTDPEYGSVGLTESQAAQDHDIAVGLVRYDELLRAVADGHPEGFCKLIADRRSHRSSALTYSATTPLKLSRSSRRP